jgi:acetyltransferase-like isoleucine patch superfamily enzyme
VKLGQPNAPEKRQHNLQQTYARETDLERYIRLTVGEGASRLALVGHELLLGLCAGLPGLLGLGLRHWLYPLVFKGFDRKTYLGRHVTLRCPRQIELGKRVVIDDYVQLVATSRRADAIQIGSGSFVRSYAMLNAGPPDGFIHIGNECTIGQATILYGNGGLAIGNKVMIAGQCFIVASSHNFDDPLVPMRDQGFTTTGITIADNVWIGAGAKILDGVTIGEGAIIGANAVVNRSVAPGARVAGVPARDIGAGMAS